jgi:hypothetical protein
MFLRYFDFVFKPFRQIRNRIVKVKTVKGNIKVDVNRVKNYKNMAGAHVNKAKGMAGKVQAQGAKVQGQAGQIRGQAPGPPPGMPGAVPGGPNMATGAASGYPGAPYPYPPVNQPPPIVAKGALWWRKHYCSNCGQQLDKTWDACPYCAQAGAAPAAGPMKTQAIMMDAAGIGSGVQLLGWLVPLKGPLRGELFSLAPNTVVGTEPSCNVVLIDQYMSNHHAEIKAEGGVWILRDLKSTNGTYVNDKRVEQHELVDNDFVRFGQSLVKFKCL